MTNRSTARLGGPAGCAALVLGVLLACGCGSSANASASSAASATANTCQQVSAVLSDGPDPGADPVGYAEAQILPLRQISSPNPALHAAIDQLADAYQQFFASDGKGNSAKEAVVVASNKVNSICPGAAS
jgi:hypothetical protein